MTDEFKSFKYIVDTHNVLTSVKRGNSIHQTGNAPHLLKLHSFDEVQAIIEEDLFFKSYIYAAFDMEGPLQTIQQVSNSIFSKSLVPVPKRKNTFSIEDGEASKIYKFDEYGRLLRSYISVKSRGKFQICEPCEFEYMDGHGMIVSAYYREATVNSIESEPTFKSPHTVRIEKINQDGSIERTHHKKDKKGSTTEYRTATYLERPTNVFVNGCNYRIYYSPYSILINGLKD